jgi:formyltetrahydrofolate deformylase
MAESNEFVLTIACPDRPGIVYAVSGFLVQHSGNIVDSAQFDDRLDDRFFMRVHFETLDGLARAASRGVRARR